MVDMFAGPLALCYMEAPLRGGTRSIHDRGSDVTLGLKIYTLSMFLGQEICHIFF